MESYEWEKSLESDDIEHFQKLFHLMNNTQRTVNSSDQNPNFQSFTFSLLFNK